MILNYERNEYLTVPLILFNYPNNLRTRETSYLDTSHLFRVCPLLASHTVYPRQGIWRATLDMHAKTRKCRHVNFTLEVILKLTVTVLPCFMTWP